MLAVVEHGTGNPVPAQDSGVGGLEFTGIWLGSRLDACITASTTPSTVASGGQVFPVGQKHEHQGQHHRGFGDLRGVCASELMRDSFDVHWAAILLFSASFIVCRPLFVIHCLLSELSEGPLHSGGAG